jgi:ubiquinol-cytochrome c reductase iron-sulfur subunit
MADRRERRAERSAVVAFAVATVAAIGLTITYAFGGDAQVEGLLLGLTLGSIGAGVVIWAKGFLPNEEATEQRSPIGSTSEEVEAFAADFRAGTEETSRRRVVLGVAIAAFTALGAALLFPVRSLGPRPGRDLKRTPYGGRILRVVTEGGVPVRPDDLPFDGVITVWPEGHTDAADAPTLLIRIRPDQDFDLAPEKMDWTVDGVVAYSKLCTHVGCPVGLYQADSALLLCPCHQSTFAVLEGAVPVFGPAARPLPQLPLALDDDGFLVAVGDFEAPVGPGFFDRGR